ncbi:MAG: alanine racemase [Desulfovibrio sp.]|jgi:alanine racemase|nr:alanine racemase [Desulfovibrio sp.]
MSAVSFTPSRCHIDLAALQRNFARLGSPASLMPVIKSDAYGHGLFPVARALTNAGARRFAVGTAGEGVALREAGFSQEIVPLTGGMALDEWRTAAAHTLTPVIGCFEDMDKAAACSRHDRLFRVALKFDTGMARLGFSVDDLPDVLERLRLRPGLSPVLVLSHMACADMPDDLDYSTAQIERFTILCAALRIAFPDIERSLANSAATLGLPESHFDVCRPGIALYGGNPLADTAWEDRGGMLEWVMSVSAPVVQVRRINAGQSVSYGRQFTAPDSMTVAVITAGYATGIARGLSNHIDVLIDGRRAPQIGRICMGLLVADVSAIPDVRVGDTAWILGGQGAPGVRPVSALEMARELGTIPYEILCRMGGANPRVYN